jgi:hypothetical protein
MCRSYIPPLPCASIACSGTDLLCFLSVRMISRTPGRIWCGLHANAVHSKMVLANLMVHSPHGSASPQTSMTVGYRRRPGVLRRGVTRVSRIHRWKQTSEWGRAPSVRRTPKSDCRGVLKTRNGVPWDDTGVADRPLRGNPRVWRSCWMGQSLPGRA